jgi:hypothetical protein
VSDDPVDHPGDQALSTEDAESAATEPDEPATQDERRRQRQRVFGDVLPDRTRDEVGDGGSDADGDDSDEWLRRQKPPHHG